MTQDTEQLSFDDLEPEERGLYRKYRISKADGSSVDPHAKYFVLRLDSGAEVEACRAAAYAFAFKCKNRKLALDLLDVLGKLVTA